MALNSLFATTAYGAETPASIFSDLSGTQQTKSAAITEANRQGLLSGDPSGQFRPSATMTRQEIAVVLAKALKLNLPAADNSSFADVSSSGWANSAIEAVKEAGLMTGDGSGRFHPNQPVSREELAAIFVRSINASDTRGGTASPVNDLTKVSGWAQQSTDVALRLNLITTPGEQFDPKGNILREDIASFLLEIFKAEQQTSVIDGIDGDVVTIDGIPYLIEGKLKELIGDTNREALKGAILKFNSLNRHVDGLQGLEIVQPNVTLNTAGLPSDTVLSVSGNDVTIKGNVSGDLIIKEGAAHIEVQGQIGQTVIESASPVTISGTGSLQNMKVVQAGAKVTVDPALSIQKLFLPDNVLPAQVIQNYGIVQGKIAQSYNTGGLIVPAPAVSAPSAPTVTVPVITVPVITNHNPVPGSIEGSTLTENGLASILELNEYFNDEDEDALAYEASSGTPSVVEVSVSGSELTLTPKAAGTSIITVTASDGKGGIAHILFSVNVAQIIPPVIIPPVIPPVLPPIPPLPPMFFPPYVAAPISNTTAAYTGNGFSSISLTGVFLDITNNPLTYTVSSGNTTVADAEIDGLTIKITPKMAGSTLITVTANNGMFPAFTSFIITFTVPEEPAPTEPEPEITGDI